MPTEDAYSSGHLVLSHFGTCMYSNVETNLSWTCLASGILNFEHPSVLLFCLYKSLLKRCTLTNKAAGTIWRALSKPPQSRPLWLLVGTSSAFGPELAYRLRVAQPRYFWYTFILLYMFVNHILWPLHFGWLLVLSLYKEDYLQILKCASFWLHGFCG